MMAWRYKLISSAGIQ